ncbi:methylase of polypeptide subunit release factors [Pseudomonas sp. TE3786]
MKPLGTLKRYRTTYSSQTRLGQIMTPQPLADAVVRLLGAKGGRWLELGSGSGRLAEAVYRGAAPESYVGVEIEEAMIERSPHLPDFTYLNHDVLAADSLAERLQPKQFDHVIGNPPYGIQGLTPAAKERLHALCPELETQGSWAPIDLYFVLESISKLKSNGTAAFIVGADIPRGPQSKLFRKMLMDSASQVQCYELPTSSFGRTTEVQAYVLIVKYGRTRARHVTLGRLNEQFEPETLRAIDPLQAIESMDLRSIEFAEMDAALRRASNGTTLQDLGVTVIRGSRTSSQFLNLGVHHFHTSHFPKVGTEISLQNVAESSFQLATIGDMLLPRVGTRCLGHKAIVVAGQSPFTESVFRVRAPAKHQDRVARFITSIECANWRRAAASGACAKHLTVSKLLHMPVPA